MRLLPRSKKEEAVNNIGLLQQQAESAQEDARKLNHDLDKLRQRQIDFDTRLRFVETRLAVIAERERLRRAPRDGESSNG